MKADLREIYEPELSRGEMFESDIKEIEKFLEKGLTKSKDFSEEMIPKSVQKIYYQLVSNLNQCINKSPKSINYDLWEINNTDGFHERLKGLHESFMIYFKYLLFSKGFTITNL